MEKLQLLKNYVPRHMRLGVCCSTPEVESFQEVVEQIPIVDGSNCVMTQSVVKQVPSDEVMSKYKLSFFRLSALVKAGVPLEVVNVNHSSSFTIDELERVCKNVDSAQFFIDRVNRELAERKSWFSEPEPSVDESTEVYP